MDAPALREDFDWDAVGCSSFCTFRFFCFSIFSSELTSTLIEDFRLDLRTKESTFAGGMMAGIFSIVVLVVSF